ncbi:10684_t:CDS:2, partial [Racocetra fulgida]
MTLYVPAAAKSSQQEVARFTQIASNNNDKVSQYSLFIPRIESFSTILNIPTIPATPTIPSAFIPTIRVGATKIVPTEITTAIPISTTANIPFTNTVKATTLKSTIQTMTTAPVTIQQKTPSITNTATSSHSTYNQLPSSTTTSIS